MYHTTYLYVSIDQINSTRSNIGFTEVCASAGRAGGQNVRFLCYFTVLFLFRWFDTMRTDSSYPPIPFFPCPPQYSSCFSLISDRGGDAPWCLIKRAGTNDRAHSSRERVIIIIILRVKNT